MAAVRSVAAVAWVEEAPWVPPVGADAGEGVAGPASGEGAGVGVEAGAAAILADAPSSGEDWGPTDPEGVGDPGPTPGPESTMVRVEEEEEREEAYVDEVELRAFEESWECSVEDEWSWFAGREFLEPTFARASARPAVAAATVAAGFWDAATADEGGAVRPAVSETLPPAGAAWLVVPGWPRWPVEAVAVTWPTR